MRRYTRDSEVDVYYDPDRPGDALLERRVSGAWILWVIAGAFVGVALVLLLRR